MTLAKAFTLVEVLIVVLILGILGSIVLPQFSNASAIARASMLADDLRTLRMQLELYKGQHTGVPPGYPNGDRTATPTEADFVAQLTQSSTADGETAAPGTEGYHYGPYLREIPKNPVNGKSTAQIIGNTGTVPGSADDSHGWIYQPSTMTIKADCIGSDDAGKSYFTY